MQNKGKLLRLALTAVGAILIFVGIVVIVSVRRVPASFGAIDESILLQIPAGDLPADTLYITEGRRQYLRGDMTLIIPSIEVDTPVGESTLPEGLKEMPGLYEFSQLPGDGDINVSIAGHRDIHDQVFLHADEISHGDYAYLIYEGIAYRYIYKDMLIVKPDNWDVIKPQGFSCLTITTCDPVGSIANRLIVQFELVDCQTAIEAYSLLPYDDTGEIGRSG